MRRVVITGIGPLCARSRGKDPFWRMLLSKEAPLERIPDAYEERYKYKTRYYVPAPRLDGYEKSMEEISKIAVECAGLALTDAGLETLESSGVILGVGMGSLSTAFTSYVAHTQGEGRFNRLVIPLSMPNAPAAWIALKFGADKACFTINGACASGTMAVGEAYQRLTWGEMDTVLAGGVDCLEDPGGAILRGFDSLQALTTAEDGLPRPFSSQRSGFLFNMGAGCCLILEELECAKKRGADIYAELTGYACNTAAAGIIQMPEDYRRLLPLFEMVKEHKIDYFNAHGTGTRQNDALEAEIIRRLWGKADSQPFIGATKGIIGHSIGAGGALEAAVTALSIRNGAVHGNLTEDVEAGLNCPTESRELSIENALSASYGFGGHNALLMLKRWTG